MHISRLLALSCLIVLWPTQDLLMAAEPPPQADEQQAAQEDGKGQDQDLFPPDQIEQLVAPIALYPDALIAQILMAATYPLDIVQADRWLRDQGDLEGEALEKAADEQPWDPSVKTLVFFPSVLQYMSENLDWTQDLGDAMLAQQQEVMGAVQSLRADAQEAGTLKTTEQQRVETEGDTIVVQPADPEVVYVPTYNPSTVYGQTAPPATTYYPATYTTPVATTTSTSGSSDSWVSFGAGALVGGLLTAAILWDRNDYNVYYGGRGRYGGRGYWGSPNYWSGGWKRPVNIDRNVNISRGDVNINRQFNKWEHNPQRRGGVRYRDNSTRQKYSSVRRERNTNRNIARGRDPDRRRPGSGGAQRPGSGDRQRPGTRPAQRPATREARRPATREAARPATAAPKPAQRRDARPAAKPSQRQTARPAQKPSARNATRPASRPANRGAQRPARSSGGRSSAFNVRSGKGTRAASNRGASSRGGGRAAKRGGGGSRRAGGGGRGAGGGRRR